MALFNAATKPTPTNSATNSLEKPTRTTTKEEPLSGSFNASNDVVENSHSSSAQPSSELPKPMLSEDYAELGLGEEEGDYSTPAARNYELDRSQITLNEIIGVGQFGDVHIGTCRIKKTLSAVGKKQAPESEDGNSDHEPISLTDDNSVTNGENNNDRTGLIQVAVKKCKADADITTTEKFLEEACKKRFFLYFKSEVD